MTEKHTPGPWEAVPFDETTGWKIVPAGSPDFKICRIENSITYLMAFDEQAEGDARLIAAAPEMLEALKGLAAVIGKMKPATGEPYGRGVTELLEARAAIAKATGGES